MPISVKVDVSAAVEGLYDFEKNQLPFAMAKTLTGLAQDAQVAVRANVRKAFTLRNTWTEQGIRIQAADRRGGPTGNITATVYTDTSNHTTGAPDYLGRQEEGGERVPVGGRQFIAVPTKYLRQMAPGVIPAELRPRALLGAVGGRFARKARKGQMALQNQRLVKGFDFFLQTMKDGDKAIMGRYFTDRDAYPFYLLITEAHIRKSGLDMADTVARVAIENFQQRWNDNWRDIRLRGIRL